MTELHHEPAGPKDERESFIQEATDLFTTVAKVTSVTVCNPNELYCNLHSAEQFARNTGDCHAVRVAFEDGTTMALTGSPQGDVARFDVWTGEYSGPPQFVLSDCHDAEESFLHWTAFQARMSHLPNIDRKLKAIAEKLIAHPYVSKCSIGSTYFIIKPVEYKTVTYEWR